MTVARVWFLILISTLVLNHVSRSKYSDYWSFIQKEGLKDQWKRNCDMRWFYLIPNQKIISPIGELLWLSHSETDMKTAKNHQLMTVSKCLLHPSAQGRGEATTVWFNEESSCYLPTKVLSTFPSFSSYSWLCKFFISSISKVLSQSCSSLSNRARCKEKIFSSLEPHNLKRRESLCDCWHQSFLFSEEERVSETELKLGPGTSRPIHLLLVESTK